MHLLNLLIFSIMASLSDRRKLKSSRISRDDEEMLTNTRTQTKTFFKNGCDDKKIIKQLEQMINEERSLRKDLEENLLIEKGRTMMREKQFYAILEKTHQEVQKYMKAEANSHAEKKLGEIFDDIFVKFQESNQATNLYIEKRYKESLSMMERRVHQIMQVVDAEVGRTKQISDEKMKGIKRQIQLFLSFSNAIQDENRKLKMLISKKQFENKVLKQEKQLLLAEVVEKKAAVFKMSNICRDMKRKMDKVDFDRSNTINLSKQRQQLSTTKEKSYFSKPPAITINEFNPNTSLKLENSKPGKVLLRKSLGHKKFNCLMKNTMRYEEKEDISCAQKTIMNLRSCLLREKKKVMDLGNIVTQIQNKNNEINDAIMNAIEESKKEGNDKSLDTLLKSEKLFQTIRDLKKRLKMCEKPSLHCGWGSIDDLDESI